jgi:DeoR family transcriptional regulator, glycerol-3-phosphate regulon repressor
MAIFVSSAKLTGSIQTGKRDRMDVESRQEMILNLLRSQDRVGVDDLAGRFQVSTQTIRSDLRDLAECGLVARVHGGARRVHSAANRNYNERRKLNPVEKEALGFLAASLIPDNCSVALNIGTTTEQVAKALVPHQNLVVLSNNINIINLLTGDSSKELVLVGGAVRQSDGAIVGADAVEFISRYKVDYAVIGASAVDTDGAILDYDSREVSVARAILRNARTRILAADGSKFHRTAPVRICDVSDLDYIVTDVSPPSEFVEVARRSDSEILIVGGP